MFIEMKKKAKPLKVPMPFDDAMRLVSKIKLVPRHM
jgi:hypothetical protein